MTTTPSEDTRQLEDPRVLSRKVRKALRTMTAIDTELAITLSVADEALDAVNESLSDLEDTITSLRQLRTKLAAALQSDPIMNGHHA